MKKTLRIINEKGLHARASAKFVECVDGFDAMVRVSKDGIEADGDSILGLLMLAAAKGTTIEIETSGAQADALADALVNLIADRFGEAV